MFLIINDERDEFTNDLKGLEKIIEKINQKIDQSGDIFSHLIINDREIYDGIEQYLEQHVNEIQEIEVVMKPLTDYVNETILTLEKYLKNLNIAVNQLTDYFYNHDSQAWADFDLFLQGIEWVNQIVMNIDSLKEKPNKWEEAYSIMLSVKEELINLEEPLGNQDNILIADIIQYEIGPLLASLSEKISTIIDLGVPRHDVS